MTKGDINPWESMNVGASRRIDSEISHEVFWIKDEQGHYGFYLRSSEKLSIPETDIHLKGVSLIKRNALDFGELFLVLNKQADWELFLSLCKDILSVCYTYALNAEMIQAVESRLKRWQIFLMQNNDPLMSLEMQMGLFSELQYLKALLPSRGIKESILAWTGPNKDKQDFNFSDTMFEVKSYTSSKGPKVTISSTHQLLSESKHLYLVSYGLTPAEKGNSIKDLLFELDTLLSAEQIATQHLFENKVISYGYMPHMGDQTLMKFTIDSVKCFEVTPEFPKLLPHQVSPEITNLNYTIDLGLCKKYEKPLSFILTPY